MQTVLSKSRAEYEQDRRWHIRYSVHGTAELAAGGMNYSGIPLELSLGGVNLQMKRRPPVGQVLKLRLDIYGFGEMIDTEIRVIRTSDKTATAIFLTPQSSMARCISWLSNYERKAADRLK